MKCTINKCKNECNAGDSLFCNSHRIEWRLFCDINHLEEASQVAVDYFLKNFQEGIFLDYINK